MSAHARDRVGRPRTRAAALGVTLALLATLLWASNFVLARGLREAIPPVALNFWRWTIAVALLAPFAIKTTIASRTVLRRHLRYLSLTGLLGVTAFNTLVYQAGHTTEALNLALVAVCSPIVIVVLAWLLAHEHVSGSTVLGLGLAAGGVLLLITNGRLDRLANLDFAVGDLLMLIATVLFGSYTVLVRRKPDEIPITAFVFSTFVLGLLMLLPAYLVEFSTTGPFTTDARTVGALIYIGVFPSLLAFYAWNRAVTTIGATAPAVIYYLVPIFTGLAAWLLLDEPIGGAELLSIVLVIAGVGVGQRAI
ncbi:MAG: DMT family transporter, partial [Pseudonocardiaceae bacterium]